jgi:hypothetical protein
MTTISGMRRLDETIHRMGGRGDNWHMTWATNDKLYTGMCDGTGFPDIGGHTGMFYISRVYAINGDPPHHSFEHLPGFPDLTKGPGPDDRNTYYGFGLIALDDHLYYYLSTPNHPFFYEGARFVGSKLIHSPDLGETWLNQDGSELVWEGWAERSRDNMAFFEEPDNVFSLITVLQMGKNYEHNRDGYVYIYTPNGSVEGSMNQLAMLRVPKDRILDRSSYEYFVSRNDDGSASWSRDINDRGASLTFPSGYVNVKVHPYAWQPGVVYNAPLDVYMMSNWGMAVSDDGTWFDGPSYLGFWVADQPWGPWRQVHEETSWTPAGDELATAYQPQISPKWIAEDGKSFWMAWTDFQRIDGGRRQYYDYNIQKVEILTE